MMNCLSSRGRHIPKRRLSTYRHQVRTAFWAGLLSLGMVIGCSKDPTSPQQDDDQLEYVTPEDVGMELGLMVINARISERGFVAILNKRNFET